MQPNRKMSGNSLQEKLFVVDSDMNECRISKIVVFVFWFFFSTLLCIIYEHVKGQCNIKVNNKECDEDYCILCSHIYCISRDNEKL